ncbi:lactadherin-like [Anneissia japonica]|uniref:lactadherin-like n=1 Tax=Anneissia japonica TaxID=1529436 RepID=UPI0014254DE9|nr:lactadherin-like [Anneissia japonica]
MYRTFLSLFGIITLLGCSFAEPCVHPLGIEDRTIQLTASSEIDNYHRADRGRLNTVHESDNGYGSWVAYYQDQNQWIQAHLGSLLKVTGVITQGRQDLDQWVTSYKVLHSTGGNFEEILDASGHVAFLDRLCLLGFVVSARCTKMASMAKNTKYDNIKISGILLFTVNTFCFDALGVEDGTIPPEKLTASSEHDSFHGAHRGRLNTVRDGSGTGAWSAGPKDQNQWIQADLGSLYKVTGVITQGRHNNDQWVTSYKVLYSSNGDNFEEIMDANGQVAVFNGNSDRNNAVINMLHDYVYAEFIRINPTNWHNHISLRFLSLIHI